MDKSWLHSINSGLKMKQTKSTQPRKQRKWRSEAPLHKRRSFLGSHLDKKLQEKYNRRSIPVRKGDTVKIMKGEFRGIKGEVINVDLEKCVIYVDGVTVKKTDGTDIARAVEPSNVMITHLMRDDRKRIAMLERGMKG